MTDVVDSNGLQVSSNTELVSQLTTSFQNIYGNDINIGQNSPDGQMINIFAQGGTDIRELLVQLYNSFDPDNCSGRLLDERCALNNVFRKAGTFTTVLKVVKELRNNDIKTSICYLEKGMKQKFKYANRINVPFVLVLGEDEEKNNLVTLKNMYEGTQETLSIKDCINYIKTR